MNTQDRMRLVKSHFDGDADIFDARIVGIIPHYAKMLDAIVTSLPFSSGKTLRIADLGCGTGTLSLLVKSRFPKAHITCVDLAENMLELAAQKLKRFKDVEFAPGDLASFKFKGKYDAMVSSLAFHHLEGKKKTAAFKRIRESLLPGGVFANADLIIAAEKPTQETYIAKWEEFILKSYTRSEARQNYERYLREDRPAVLSRELKNLKTAGFKTQEIFWKYYNLVVYCAGK